MDEGRQRTTKYLSHKFVSSNHRFLTSFFVISVSVEMNIGTGSFSSDRCVGVSDQVQRFTQEHERNKRLYSAANKSDDAPPAKKRMRKSNRKDEEREGQSGGEDAATGRVDPKRGEASGMSTEEDATEQIKPEPSVMRLTPDDGKYGQRLDNREKRSSSFKDFCGFPGFLGAVASTSGSMTGVTADPVTPPKPGDFTVLIFLETGLFSCI